MIPFNELNEQNFYSGLMTKFKDGTWTIIVAVLLIN